LCRSDWHGWMGHDPDIALPHVPGHELAGVVVEVGQGIQNWKYGDRVTVPFVGGCGHRPECRPGNQQVCDNQFQPGFTAWGSFAEYVEIKKVTGRGAHVSLDALGSQETCFNSVACLRKRGKHIQVGLMTGDHKHPKVPMDQVVANELEIIGSHGMQAFRYDEIFAMIRSGKLKPQQLVGKNISLAEAPQALMNMDKFENLGLTVINEF